MVKCEESNKESDSNKNSAVNSVDTTINLTNVSSKEIKTPEGKEVGDNTESSICIDSGYGTRKVDSWCRICQEAKSDTLISPCKCRGTQGLIHISCLEHWLQVSGLSACEVCATPYIIHTVPKHSPLVSICIWLFKGGNKKFMICDFILLSMLTLMMYWMLRNTWSIKTTESFEYYTAAVSFFSTTLFAIIYLLFIYATFRFYFKRWVHWHRTRNSVRILLHHYSDSI